MNPLHPTANEVDEWRESAFCVRTRRSSPPVNGGGPTHAMVDASGMRFSSRLIFIPAYLGRRRIGTSSAVPSAKEDKP